MEWHATSFRSPHDLSCSNSGSVNLRVSPKRYPTSFYKVYSDDIGYQLPAVSQVLRCESGIVGNQMEFTITDCPKLTNSQYSHQAIIDQVFQTARKCSREGS